MAFSYLDETSVFDALKDSQVYMRPLFEPLQEFERIARNRPYPGIDKAYPKVTDGTTASVIQKTPRRIIQQLPTGLVKSDSDDWLTSVSGFILTHKIIPNANSQYAFIQKCWNAVSKALTYGSQPAYIPFVHRGQYFGTDMVLPYVKDVFLEPGKLSDADSNYIIMRSWYQPRDIEAIIATQAKAKEGQSGWDLKALEAIKNSLSQKDDLSTTPAERDKNNRSGGIEIFHAFQRGIGAKFYSFTAKDKTIVRTWTNPDPRGEIPIHYLYADTDGSNPLGRGFVELVGSMQNLMDAEVQMYQYNRALMLNPPLKKRGEWNDAQAKFQPNVLIDLGSNPGNDLEPLIIDTSAIQNFPNNYGLMKSQLLNLLSSPDTSVSAEVGNPGFSKTDAGVKSRQADLNVDDNYIRKQTETWLERVFETQLNLYFANKKGVEELQLDQETADEIREDNPEMVSEDNKIRLDYDTETEALHFEVDAGSSEIQDDTEEVAELKEILADYQANPQITQQIQAAGKTLNIGEVYKQLFSKLHLEDIDKIVTDIPTGPDGQPQMTPAAPPDLTGMTGLYKDLDPMAKSEFLKRLEIPSNPNQIAQYEAQKAALEAQAKTPASDPNDPMNHPIIKLMASLQIKFNDLPQDSQEEVLSIIGIPTRQLTPTSADTALKAIDQQHQLLSGQEAQQNQQAQMQQQDAQNQQDNALAQQQQAAQEQQNQAQNDMAQQQHDATVNQNAAQNQLAAQSQEQAAAGQQMSHEAAMTKAGVKPSKPKEVAKPKSTTPSDNLTPEDHQFIGKLQAMGVPDQMIGQALAMLHHGHDQAEVIKMIQGAMQGAPA